ncbi:MAG TPA: asparagine synthase (glutamine-hydrolyzing) [Bacteroidales bacterium]|nr:asparagine synthase (glutamine-hydrolyzing) [Bacteroidales bacterium]
MCGICGFLHFEKERSSSFESVKRMADSLIHRGPDSDGFFTKNNIALGHRRLSIIDLSTGDQPMFNDDRTVVLIFNGEIYNYIELKEVLIALGYKFYTTSDSEVIIRAYEEWDINCLDHFNGAWAIAIWDEKKQRLFLSRDRTGEKPLYYSVFDNTIVFGSEIKALLAYGVSSKVNEEMTELYFGLMNIPAPHTFYKNIYQVEPANYLIVVNGEIKTYRYWKLPERDEAAMLKDKTKIYSEFERLLTDSVRIRMRSDVPFGAFLSGGLDSSTIVALMSRLSEIPVRTFTIGFENPDYDESRLASLVAEKYSTQHFRGTVLPEQFDEAIEKTLYHYDGPFGDSSAIPTGKVSKFASQHVKMVLTGDGGDEILSGYVSYQGMKLNSWYRSLPTPARDFIPGLISFVSQPVRGRLRFRMDKFGNAAKIANLEFNSRMTSKIPTTPLQTIKEMLPPSPGRITLEDYFSQVMSQCPYNDEFYKLMYFNFVNSLPNDYLVKVDRMSMASSLEARIPFLDHRLIEFMAGVHKDIKMQGLERKSILRRTIGRELPVQLLKAKKKGFGIPLIDWFRKKEFEDRLVKLKKSNIGFNKDIIDRIIKENNTGIRNNGNFIWMLFLYERWIRDPHLHL